MTLADRVAAVLDRAGIPHALIGAAALAACGIARSTFDIDILAVDSRCLDAALWRDLEPGGVTIDLRRGDAADPLAGVVRLEQSGERPVDLVVGRHTWQARALARALRPAGSPPVVQGRDLVLLKLYAGGTQDMWDIRELLALQDADRLVEEVNADVADLPVDAARRWSEVRDARR
jgi:hypothetical protein